MKVKERATGMAVEGRQQAALDARQDTVRKRHRLALTLPLLAGCS